MASASFAQPHLAMLGLRRLLVVDEAPSEVEDLLRQKARDQAGGDAEGDEQELAHRYACLG